MAVAGGRLAGFRTFVRWEFDHPDGRVRRAVRAVDTATHPDFQGRGVFKTLTLHAVDELRDEGVDFVFNTPNAQSRPGYLKMGWHEVGRLPVWVRPAGPGAALRMARARVPAGKWSLPCEAGHAAAEVLRGGGLDALLGSQPPARHLRTRRSGAFLAWRYGLPELRYRVLTLGIDAANGFVVFRLRPRGQAIEVVVADVVVPAGDTSAERALLRRLASMRLGDYLIRIDRRRLPAGRFLPLVGQGPILTWRSLVQTDAPGLADWDLVLGDIELF